MGSSLYSQREVRRLLAVLGIFVAVPCLLLVFLAWQSVQILHESAQAQQREACLHELQDIGVQLHGRLRDLLAGAGDALNSSAPSEMRFWIDVRQWMAAEPAVRAVLALDADGRVAWPARQTRIGDLPGLSAVHPAHAALQAARRSHWADRDFSRARDHYRQVLTEPRLPASIRIAVWAEMAACARAQGDLPAALDACRNMLALTPKLVPPPLAWLRAVEMALESGEDALARDWADGMLADGLRRGLDLEVRELQIVSQRLRRAWPDLPSELAEMLAQTEQATAARAAGEAFVRVCGGGPFRSGFLFPESLPGNAAECLLLVDSPDARHDGSRLAVVLDWDVWQTAALEPVLQEFTVRHGGRAALIPAPAPAGSRSAAESGQLVLGLPAPLGAWAIEYRAEPVSMWVALAATHTKTRAVLLGLAIILALLGLVAPFLYLRRSLRLAGLQADVMDRISHELKTPIAALAVLADKLQPDDAPSGSPVDRRVRQLVQDEINSLMRLNDRFLNYARHRTGPVPLVREAGRLDELLAAILPGLPEKTGLAPERLDFAIQRADYAGEFDREALAEILRNLLENAVKYCAAPARVRLSLRREDSEALLEVADNGPGMSPRMRRRLFIPYFRADSRLAARVPGLGLGLAIVKGLVTAHGGTITVRSQPPNGSTFAIRLPLGVPSGDPA